MFTIPLKAMLASAPIKMDPIQAADSTVKIFNPNWSRHNHFLEFSAFLGIISYQPTADALGYKYLFNTDWNYKLKLGGRAGVWWGRTGDDIPDNKARNYISYSAYAIGSLPIWKSISVEISSGITDSKSWPAKTNTEDEEKLYAGIPFYNQKLGVNLIMFKHLNLELGAMFLWNSLSKNWNSGSYLSVGYKF